MTTKALKNAKGKNGENSLNSENVSNEKLVHKTVLLKESIQGLEIKKGDIYLDGTLGSGGHAIEALRAGAEVIGLDRDEDAILRAKKRFEEAGFSSSDFSLVKENFRNMDEVLPKLGKEKVNRIMLDLGLSSDQLETSGRGFTFKKNEILLMTFKKNLGPEDLTAMHIVNDWDEANIADIIYGWGEERFSRRIARAIVEAREIKPITTSGELADIISKAVPGFYRNGKIHPATKTFQAIRITVNDEIGALQDALRKGFEMLDRDGRMAVISFHSIEDRIVKRFINEKSKLSLIRQITKKPITASIEELRENPRSRSAKLRIFEKVN